jgi:hypothetical protein
MVVLEFSLSGLIIVYVAIGYYFFRKVVNSLGLEHNILLAPAFRGFQIGFVFMLFYFVIIGVCIALEINFLIAIALANLSIIVGLYYKMAKLTLPVLVEDGIFWIEILRPYRRYKMRYDDVSALLLENGQKGFKRYTLNFCLAGHNKSISFTNEMVSLDYKSLVILFLRKDIAVYEKNIAERVSYKVVQD